MRDTRSGPFRDLARVNEPIMSYEVARQGDHLSYLNIGEGTLGLSNHVGGFIAGVHSVVLILPHTYERLIFVVDGSDLSLFFLLYRGTRRDARFRSQKEAAGEHECIENELQYFFHKGSAFVWFRLLALSKLHRIVFPTFQISL
jgi:hypothetical protein